MQVTAYDVCELIRVQVLDALEAVLPARPITTSYVGLGLVAWDDCCGQLTVGTERIFRYVEFPNDNTDPERCDPGDIGLEVVVTLVRCVATPDDAGNGPTADALAQSHHDVQDDAAAVWNVANGPLPDDTWERANVAQTFIGGDGGCVSVETRFTLGIDAAAWCQ